MMKFQEFQSTNSALAIAAFRNAGKNTIRVYGSEADIARGLFAPGEVAAPAIIHFSQATGEAPAYWAERTFRSRTAALTFLFAQAIRFGMVKGARS